MLNHRVRILGSVALAVLLILGAFQMFPLAVRGQWIQAMPAPGYSIGNFSNAGSQLYASALTGGTSTWVVVSTDNGLTWWEQNGTLPAGALCALALGENILYAAPCEGQGHLGVARSTDEGESWTRFGIGLSDPYITSLAVIGPMVFAGTYRGETFEGTDTGGGVFRSTDSGITWTAVNNGLSPEAPVYKLVVNGARLYAGTGSGIFVSNDSGKSWTSIFNNWAGGDISAFAVNGDNIIVNLYLMNLYHDWDSIFFSSDNGLHWQLETFNVQVPGAASYFPISFAFSGSKLFASIEDAVLWSTDSGRNWKAIHGPSDYNAAMIISGPNLIVGTNATGILYLPLSDFGISSVTSKDVNESVFVLPNPTPGLVTIHGLAGGVIVTNVLGEWVAGSKNRPPVSGEVTVDLSRLPAGTYFVRIETPTGVIIQRVVKE